MLVFLRGLPRNEALALCFDGAERAQLELCFDGAAAEVRQSLGAVPQAKLPAKNRRHAIQTFYFETEINYFRHVYVLMEKFSLVMF